MGGIQVERGMALVLGGRSLDERMTVVVVVAFFFVKVLVIP